MKTATISKTLWEVAPDKVDKLGKKLFPFWTPEQFGRLIQRSSQQVRFFIRELGCFHHGVPHRGGSTLRLGESALEWFHTCYQPYARRKGRHFRFQLYRPDLRGLDEIECHHLDEKQAWARLFNEPVPYDKYLEDNPDEKRKWKKFVELRINPAKLRKWNQSFVALKLK
jgi:hypothetical protein